MQMPGEALLIKMWETLIEKGIGGLIVPYYVIWKNRKLALSKIELDKQCRIATSKAEQEIAQITSSETKLIGYETLPSEENASEVSIKNIINNDVKRLIREEINVAKAINYANERLIEDFSETPKDEINQDWLNTWRDNASKVSNEEVQSLWGNVLAQEFLEPGRYSLRLLEFLRTMSKSDALLIEKIAPFISNDRIIYKREKSNNNLFNSFNIMKSELSFLEEIGIIFGVSAGGMVATANNLNEEKLGFLAAITIDENTTITISSSERDKVVKYGLYEMTKIGSEVLSLIGIGISSDYVAWLGNQFVEDFKVEIFKKIDDKYELEKTL